MMKHTKLILTLLCLVLFSGMAQAQGNDASTPITQADLGGRKALVGPGCIVNQFATNVQLLSGITGLENLVDEDLDNYATFTTGAGVGVTEQPLFSVKDMYNTYAAGTEAGICMVSSQSGGLLSLSVISLFSILVYNDGELVETISDLTGGQAGSGVALDLIKIPGSDNLSVNLTCTPQHDFDELYVVQSGGLDVSVIKQLKFKYAFVGEPRQCLMVNESDKLDNDIADYAEASGRGVSGKKPTVTPQASCTTVLFPTPTVDADNLADDNLDNGTQIISVLSIAYKGSAKVSTDPGEPICGIKNRNPEPTVTFPAGSEVGFVYTNGSALNLSLGNAVQLKIYNTDGTTQTENIEAGVLSLGVAEGGKMTSSAIAEKEFYAFEIGFYAGLNADVGDISVHYGFVNEPAIVPHRCDINPSVDSDICDVQGTYQLLSNPSVGVEWTLESAYGLDGTTLLPEGAVTVTPSGKVTFNDIIVPGNEEKNIIYNGIFTFKATAVGCTHAPKCTAKMVLRRGINTSDSGCSDPIFNEEGAKKYALSEDTHGSSGSLISISDIENSEYILDGNFNNYATYTGGLSLASNIHVIGVKTEDDSYFATSTETDGKKVNKRIGFIVESESTFLNADVLQFFQIRCYNKEGKEVYRQLVDESNAVGVGLIEEAQSQKMRFSIEVPANIDFDEFALWTAGVLKLDISTLRIYYPFIEDNSLDCANPLKCATPITAKDGASAYPEMKFQTASIAGVVQNLGNLIDDDMDTYFRYQNTVQAGSGMVVSVKLGKTLDYRHQFGIVMDTETFLAGVGLGTWMTVETYYNGQPTGDKFDNWGVLGLNLIGYGDKSYLVNTPTRNFDEIRITFAGVANVLNSNKLYGIFFRSDKNLNGIPDCMDPDPNCAEDLDLKTTNVCAGENMVLTGKVQGASEGYQVVVKAPEQDNFESEPITIDKTNHTFSVEIPTTEPGTGLNVMVYGDNGRFLDGTTYVVHPIRTTWRKTPINTDWNEPNNWEGNVNPYCCTDVIIPDGATLYPVLQSVDPDSKAPLADNYYCCNGIYFQASPDGDEDNPAQIVNVPQLAYHKAWVDVRMMPNRYYMFSAPLRNTLTGDLFVPAEMNGQLTGLEFEDLGDDNAKQNRFNPRVFQRMWKSNPQVRWLDHIYYGGNDGTTEMRQDKWSDAGLEDTKSQMADWSKHFNAMQQAYSYTQGFSVWMDNGDLPADQAIITRLPKKNTYYNYYTPDGDELPEHDGIIGSDDVHNYDDYTDKATNLNRRNNTRFIYEQKDYENDLTYADTEKGGTVRYGAKKGDNPFATGELSIEATTGEAANNFVVGNMFMSDIDIKTFLEVNKNVKALRRYNGNTYETYALTDGNTLLTTMAADESDNEMEEAAVKERKKVIHPLESFFIDLAEKDKGTYVSVKFTPAMMMNTVAEKDEATTEQAAIRLTAEVGGKRSAMIVSGAETGINTETMLDADVKPSTAIFAAIEGKAQDITSTDLAQIPLGIIAENDTLTFHATAEGGMDISEWELVDLSDGRSYSIDTPVTFTNVGNSVGRFILRSQSSTTGIESPESHSVYVKAQGDKATITTIQGDIASVEVFTTAGVLYARAEATGSSCTVNIPTGQVAIVHVTLSDGSEESVKVLSTRR